MREVKFRGKAKDTQLWVDGDLLYDGFHQCTCIRQHAHIPPTYSEPGGDYWQEDTEVIDETVGEYTGLKDSQGNEIYEGDLVQVSNYLSSVEWDNVGHRWCRRVQARLGPDHKWHTKGPNAPDHFPVVGFSSIHWPMTVIGNIHDNIELLNQ